MKYAFLKKDARQLASLVGLTIVTTFAIFGLGCANEASKPQALTQEGDEFSGYENVALENGGMLRYKKLTDATFGYDSIHVADVGIEYAKRSTVLTASEKNQVKKLLQSTLAEQIARFGSLVTDKPGVCTASEYIYLKDLNLYKSNVSGSQSTIVRSLGSVTIVSEFRDSTTGDLIFRYEERKGLGGGRRDANRVDILRLSKTLGYMLDEMAPKVFVALPKGSANSRAHFGCEGKVGKQLYQMLQS